jgi:hypothetical protein
LGGDRAWKSCLVRIKKPELKMKMDFEYDDALRWKVTPANLATKVESASAALRTPSPMNPVAGPWRLGPAG